jgi:hypothetical protein
LSNQRRERLASLSFADKLKLLEKLRERELAIRAAREKMKASQESQK